MTLLLENFVAPPLSVNTYLVADPVSREALLIDPGGRLDEVARVVEREGFRLRCLLATHAHVDHVWAAANARERFGAPLLLHPGEEPLLRMLPVQAMLFGFPDPAVPHIDRWVAHGERLQLGEIEGQVLLTPGHSPGGCCLFFPSMRQLFTGDTLFAGSIGRSDLPGGSHRTLVDSIRSTLLPLGDEVAFYPGHGPSGTLGRERRSNPFVTG